MLTFAPDTAAWGQEVAAEPGDKIAPEVVVYADGRRSDRLDVPFAVSAISQDTAERLGSPTLRNLSMFVPGLFVEAEAPGRPYIAVRGVATDVPDAASEPRVAIFQDGVSQARRQGALGELFDVGQIEVSRGPQTTLFGRSALIGAVSITSNRADPGRFGSSARVELGSLGTTRIDGMVNAPVADGVAVRIATRIRRADGYVDDLDGGDAFNGFRNVAVRGSARIARGPGTVDLIAGYERDRTNGVAYKSGTFLPSDAGSGAVLGDLSPFHGAALSPGSGFVLGDALGGERTLTSLTALGAFDLVDGVTLSTTTGYRAFHDRNTQDLDGTSLRFLTTGEINRGDAFSQEIRLSYDAGSRFKLLFGGNLFVEDVERTVPVQIDERLILGLLFGSLDRRNPVLRPEAAYTAQAANAALLRGVFAARGITLATAQSLALAGNLQATHREQYTNDNSSTAADLFGDVTLEATRRLQLQGSVRFTSEQRRASFVSSTSERSVAAGILGALRLPVAQAIPLLRGLSAPGAPFIPVSAAYPLPMFAVTSQPSNGVEARGLSDRGVSWRLAARYALSPSLRLFASYGRGRRPAVTSAAAPLTPGGPVIFRDLAAETLNNVEAGAKLRTPGGLLSVEAVAYRYTYSNFQTQLLEDNRVVSVDAGRARAYGAELEMRLQPLAALGLVGTYAYNHARFESGLFDGNRFRLNPDHSASLALVGRASVAGASLEIAPSVAYRSRLYFDDTNGVPALLAGALLEPINYQASQSGYAVANIRAALNWDKQRRWRVELFANNLLDKRYLRDTGAGSLDFGLPTYIAAPLRVIGASVLVSY